MFTSTFELFKIGIGPSSSHTVGPMRAANRFVELLVQQGLLGRTTRLHITLYGSLGATGRGHGTDKAVVGGLEGELPASVDPQRLAVRMQQLAGSREMHLQGTRSIEFDLQRDLEFTGETLRLHSNGIRFTAFDASQQQLLTQTYYSVGGGFVVAEEELQAAVDAGRDDDAESSRAAGQLPRVPYEFASGGQLLQLCSQHGLRISELMLANEISLLRSQAAHATTVATQTTLSRSATVQSTATPSTEANEDLLESRVRAEVLKIWQAMQSCIQRGLAATGVLPGGLNLPRRAPALVAKLQQETASVRLPLAELDWVDAWALAVSEENAAGGRVVTAPTNGAAGIIPAVLQYYHHFMTGADDAGTVRFLLTAAAIGGLFKMNASISGAEVGCQGEVGSACSMAAAGLAEVMGGSPQQIENAAEIGMEHHLGLTCDPVAGLVQVPCIERNAMAAVQAINSARLALRGEGRHFVSLDKVIRTMLQTGRDMQTIYKETSLGGLAVNAIEC